MNKPRQLTLRKTSAVSLREKVAEGRMRVKHEGGNLNLLRFVHHVISNETKPKQQKGRKNIESNVTLNFAMKVLRFSVDIMMLEENAAYQMIFLE